MEPNNLSHEQIKKLLEDAEFRLKNRTAPPCKTAGLDLQKSISSVGSANTIESYIKTTNQIPRVESSSLVSKADRKLSNGIRIVTDPVLTKKNAIEEKKATAGADWYNLPRTNLTPELKRDFQLLRMRDVLDPKRHYKKDKKRNEFPEYSQVGTIIQGPTEYFSGRLSNKERKLTLVEETLNNEKSIQRFKSKYAEIQAVKSSGNKSHYKKMQEMRTRKKYLKG